MSPSPVPLRLPWHRQSRAQPFRYATYHCANCRPCFTPQPKEQGYGTAVRELSVWLYLEGMSQRAIARILGVAHQLVGNWFAATERALPERVADTEATETIEVDELETFVGEKGRTIVLMVAVARESRLIVGQ
jgi:hypothetical protein